MKILGIETSCDETALAIIEKRGTGPSAEFLVIGSLVHSQADLHSAYGGVYPNLAKREHGKMIVPLMQKLLTDSKQFLGPSKKLDTEYLHNAKEDLTKRLAQQNPDLLEHLLGSIFINEKPDIDAIAVTEGPGLEPALWVGIAFAEALGKIWQVPVIPIDHMEGHIVGSLLPSEAMSHSWTRLSEFESPALSLLISGGHTELVYMDRIGSYKIIGETLDDALGEAYDKTARLLGLSYPGGPHVARLANEARINNILSQVRLPRPMIHSDNNDFSFSGLKTAVLYAVRQAPRDKDGNIENFWVMGLAREFEDAVSEVLVRKTENALELSGAKTLIVGGGVSINGFLRNALENMCSSKNVKAFFPARHISGDNALMIALACALKSAPPERSLRASGTKRISDN